MGNVTGYEMSLINRLNDCKAYVNELYLYAIVVTILFFVVIALFYVYCDYINDYIKHLKNDRIRK